MTATERMALWSFGALVTIVVLIRIQQEYAIGTEALVACDAALVRGDPRSAIREAQTAAEALAPLSPYPDRAYAQLAAIAQKAEVSGDRENATRAWRAVRAASLETSPWLARGDWFARANEALVRLASTGTPGDAHREALTRELLLRPRVPGVAESILLTLGALLFFFGALDLFRGGSWSFRSVASTCLGLILSGIVLLTV